MNIFYDGEARQINIFDERFYQSKKNTEVYYPSVTTILDVYPKGYGFNKWLKSVGFNADQIVKDAAEQGSNVHNMIDAYLDGFAIKWMNEEGKQNYTLKEWQMFCKFIEFFTAHSPEITVKEFQLVSEELQFGSTIDLICQINGERWLIDHKSSNYIHTSNELQIAAYAVAWNKLNPEHLIDKTGILWLNAATKGIDKSGKKIQGAGWQLKEFNRPYQEAYKIFEHTHAIWKEENPNYKPKNLIYPAEFKIKKNVQV